MVSVARSRPPRGGELSAFRLQAALRARGAGHARARAGGAGAAAREPLPAAPARVPLPVRAGLHAAARVPTASSGGAAARSLTVPFVPQVNAARPRVSWARSASEMSTVLKTATPQPWPKRAHDTPRIYAYYSQTSVKNGIHPHWPLKARGVVARTGAALSSPRAPAFGGSGLNRRLGLRPAQDA